MPHRAPHADRLELHYQMFHQTKHEHTNEPHPEGVCYHPPLTFNMPDHDLM